MNPAILNNPFMQVALPIMFSILLAARINSRGIDKGLEGVNRRLDEFIGPDLVNGADALEESPAVPECHGSEAES